MSTGKIQVYYGEGRGKTSAALGYAIHEASKGESVIVIQFLNKKMRMRSVSGTAGAGNSSVSFSKIGEVLQRIASRRTVGRADEYEKWH